MGEFRWGCTQTTIWALIFNDFSFVARSSLIWCALMVWMSQHQGIRLSCDLDSWLCFANDHFFVVCTTTKDMTDVWSWCWKQSIGVGRKSHLQTSQKRFTCFPFGFLRDNYRTTFDSIFSQIYLISNDSSSDAPWHCGASMTTIVIRIILYQSLLTALARMNLIKFELRPEMPPFKRFQTRNSNKYMPSAHPVLRQTYALESIEFFPPIFSILD